VVISAGNNRATGTVRRVEPEVQEGVVIVDVYFDDQPLAGARSDLRVDGIIQLEKLDNVLTLQRPVFSQENASLSLFVLDAQGRTAQKRLITVGKASTDAIEIIAGLNEGDRVLVSDTSRFNALDQLTLR
jgi:HlyD family secretion protein